VAGKETILTHSLLPPGADAESWLRRKNLQAFVSHLHGLFAFGDIENLARQAIVAGDVDPDDVDRLCSQLTNAAKDTRARADSVLVDFMAARKNNPKAPDS
jgi:hypothetical protein